MKLRFAPRALQDLAGIADYIVTHNPAAALRVRADLSIPCKTSSYFLT